MPRRKPLKIPSIRQQRLIDAADKRRKGLNEDDIPEEELRDREKQHQFVQGAHELFGPTAKRIIQLLNENDNEGAVTLTQKALLKSIISLIPSAEENVRNSNSTKGVYAINTLVTQCRELLSDIQANQDAELVANSINVGILQPSFISIAQFIIDVHYRMKREILDGLKPSKVKKIDDAIDGYSREVAKYLQTMYVSTSEKVSTRLVD